MVRTGAVVVVLTVLVSLAVGAQPTPEEMLVSNNSEIAFIDANDNGMHDGDDCFLNASMAPDGSSLTINGTQTDTPNKLRVCSGACFGSASDSSDSAEVGIDTCEYASYPSVPLLAYFCSSGSCTSSESGTSAGVGRPAGAPPLTIRSGSIFRPQMGLAGSGVVCSAGGPAAQIVDDSGNTVLRDLFPFPNAQNPTHMCAAQVPVELLSGGFVMRTVCFPVANGASTFALSGSPNSPFALIDFENLDSCAGRNSRAPAASEWGLMGLVLGLLIGGTWFLSRRPRFAATLPLA